MPRSGSTARPLRVLLAVDVYAGYQRRLVRGVLDYADRHAQQWQFLFNPRPVASVQERLSAYPDADGVVLHASVTRAGTLARRFQRRGVPVVFAGHRVEDLPCACADEAAVSRLAFEHLRGKGFGRFAWFGPTSAQVPVFAERRAAFAGAIAEHGLDPLLAAPDAADAGGAAGRRALRRWLASLPTPIGLFCGNLDFARRAVAACSEEALDVPTRVGVLGVDPDDLFCDMAHPPLSTIDHGMRRVGHEAARILDGLLNGGPPPPRPVLVPPSGVEQRQSTDTLAVEDDDVAAILQAIRLRLRDPATGAATLLAAVPVGRRSLEQRFRRAIGRGVQEELVRQRVELAKTLLADAGPFAPAKLPDVAARSGFTSAARLSEAFVRVAGVRPGRWRRSVTR